MQRVFFVEAPLKTVSTLNRREHWANRARRAKSERMAMFMVTPPGITPPCRVTLTRIAPRALDDDNLAASFKSVRDGIADRLGINDRDPRVVWAYKQERGEPKEYKVRAEIEEAA